MKKISAGKRNMTYTIFLDETKIGTSFLEKADAPMGCVFGQVIFIGKQFDYDFFSNYCRDSTIKTDQHSEDKFISTQIIPNLKVFNEKGTEIKGAGCYLSGTDFAGYEIYVIGIPYPFYEEEFSHHVKEYREQFR